MTFFKKNTPFIPLFFGIVFFYLIVGFGPLDPHNLGWIFGRFDPPQHYLGWAFYRYSPWSFPIGLNPNFGMDISSSIVYTDSIPIMAIFFKLLSPILPQVFRNLVITLLFIASLVCLENYLPLLQSFLGNFFWHWTTIFFSAHALASIHTIWNSSSFSFPFFNFSRSIFGPKKN